MKYIILLRGINVGGRKLKMADLRTCLEKAGYRNINTVLQTGNVILEIAETSNDKLQKQIETLLSKTFDYPAKVLVMKPEQLQEVIKNYPLGSQNPDFHRYVVFAENDFEKEMIKQAGALDTKLEAVSAGKAVVYWRVLKGHTLDSAFGKYMSKAAVKHFMTNRNVNTLEKILKKCG